MNNEKLIKIKEALNESIKNADAVYEEDVRMIREECYESCLPFKEKRDELCLPFKEKQLRAIKTAKDEYKKERVKINK